MKINYLKWPRSWETSVTAVKTRAQLIEAVAFNLFLKKGNDLDIQSLKKVEKAFLE